MSFKKLAKKVLCSATIISMALSSILFSDTWASTVDLDGEKWIQISTVYDLYNIRADLSANYIMINDIDLSEFGSWKTIGDENHSFTGVFDGNGFSILNYTSNKGSFIYDNDGEIRDLTIAGEISDVESFENRYYGGVSSKGSGKYINCQNNVTINLNNIDPIPSSEGSLYYEMEVFAGGIVGFSEGAYILNCTNNANITCKAGIGKSSTNISGTSKRIIYAAYSNAGGITSSGWANIEKCVNNGNIISEITEARDKDAYAYGIGSVIYGSEVGKIKDSINTGDIKCTNISSSDDYPQANGIGNVAESCVNIGHTTYVHTTVLPMVQSYTNIKNGCAIGSFAYRDAKIDDCYYLEGTDVENSHTGGISLSEKELSLQAAYSGLDFENVWVIESGYPKLVHHAEKMRIDNCPSNIDIGEKLELDLSIMPYNNSDAVKWESTDDDIITVNANGEITATGKGTATITVTAENGISLSKTINVLVPIKSVYLNCSEHTLEKGDTFTLVPSINPTDTTDTYSWSSSNSNVASVTDEGIVKAQNAGETTITLTTSRGLKVSCNITVIISATEIQITNSKTDYFIDDEVDLRTSVVPANTTDKIYWYSNNSNVASVDENGHVKFYRKGEVEIEAVTTSGVSDKKVLCVDNDITFTNLRLDEYEYLYNGNNIDPSVEVKYGTKVLTEGRDYSVYYNNNLHNGTAEALITGIGRYSGEKTLTFDILKNDINNTEINVDLNSEEYIGGVIEKNIEIRYENYKLVCGKDYVVEYSDNIEPGKATISIIGNNDFYGKVLKTFLITKTEYKLNYHLNGGNNHIDNPNSYYYSSEDIVLNQPTKNGYSFDGWYTDSDYSQRISTIKSRSKGSMNLYAKWKLNSYTINYVLDGGKNSIDNPVTYSIESDTVTLMNPTKEKFDFIGWYTDAEYTDSISKIKAGSYGNIILYAKFIPHVHVKKIIEKIMPSCTEIGYTEGAVCETCGEILIAVKEIPALGHKEKIDKKVDPTLDTTGLTVGSHCSVCGAILTKQEIIPKLTLFDDSYFTDIKKGKYYTSSINYLNARGVMTGLNKTEFGFGMNLSREDMVTLLWKNEGKPVYSDYKLTFKDVVEGKYYSNAVKWAKKYNIVTGYGSGEKAGLFGKGDNITRQDFIKILYGYAQYKGYDISVSSSTKYLEKKDSNLVSGYAIPSINWGYSNGFIGNNSDLNPKGNINRQDAAVIIARFLQKYDEVDRDTVFDNTQYSIKYELNGGKNSTNNPSVYISSTESIALYEPSKEGYSFAGWFGDNNFKKKITVISKGYSGDKTLYAKWDDVKYDIVFDGNGATSGIMQNMNCRYSESYTLYGNAYEKMGYSFVGWNTSKDGKGTSYSNKQSIKGLSMANGVVVTLYAQWNIIEYNIDYNLNGGNNSSNPTKYTINSSKITFTNPTKEGYTFVGWYGDAAFKSKIEYINTGNIGNITLYAKWKLSAPTNVSVKKTRFDKVSVSWNKVINSATYCVYRSTSSNGNYTLIDTTTSLSCTDSNLSAGTTYYYKIVAKYDNQVSDYSSVGSGRTAYKPNFSAQAVVLKKYNYTSFVYVNLVNNSNLKLTVGGNSYSNFCLFYPYTNALSVEGKLVKDGKVYTSLYLEGKSSGSVCFYLNNQRFVSDGYSISFCIEFDDISYIVAVDETGYGGWK